MRRSPRKRGASGPVAVRRADRRAARPQAKTRERLDVLMVSRGLSPSREQAARLILAGTVLVDGQRVDKAGALVTPSSRVEVTARQKFVSRGGEKLAHALDALGISPRGRTCLDIGASTGGFTHCLLERGAARVYAVDVGHGQLDASLRADGRVVVMEKTNARQLDPYAFPDPPDLATVDVSFISLEKVLPSIYNVLSSEGEAVCLVKPQFEVGKGQVGKGGVVRDAAHHREVITRVARFAVLHGWHARGVTASPLRGPKGNREFFLHLSKTGKTSPELDAHIAQVVVETPPV